MSALLTDKLLTACGAITNTTLGGYIDAAGNIVGSPGFLPNYVVDIAGNIGTITPGPISNCTFDVTIIGSALQPGPWEVQVGTVETVGTHESVNPTNYTAPLTNFASANTTGYMSGVVSGTGTWTIQGGTQSIGGVAYQGGGLIVTTAANTITGVTTVNTGARFQIGLDETNTTAKVSGLTVQTDAVATIFGAHTANTFVTQAIINTGTINIIGPDIPGQGVMLATTVNTLGGTINIDDANWRNQTTWTGGAGTTVNVKDGGTLTLTTNAISNTTINVEGCGWTDAGGTELGALYFSQSSFLLGANVNVKSAACIKTASGTSGQAVNGILTGSAPLYVTNLGTTLPSGNITFGSASNTYHGELTVDKTTLVMASTSLQYADVVLTNDSRISGLGTLGSLASDDQQTWWSAGTTGNSYIRDNDETTFAGRLLGDGVNGWNYWLEGEDDNILRLTHNTTTTGHTGTLYARNGSKVYLEDGTKFTGDTGQIRISLGSTLGANTTTSSATFIYMDTGAILDVLAINSTTASKITATQQINGAGGYKVNVPAGLVAGSYPILQANAGGTLPGQLPTINQNLSGLSASFSWNATNPRVLTMTLV